MPKDQNATLNSIARDIKAVNTKVDGVITTQTGQRGDIDVLLEWKRSAEVAKEAVAEYKRQEQQDKMTQTRNAAYSGIKDLMPYIIAVLSAIAALIYVHASSGGK
jgi:hypothetical protein